MDSRTRRGYLAVQFERLVEDQATRCLAVEAPVGRFSLTKHENVVSCYCELLPLTPAGLAALTRRGAVDQTFMISRKLAPAEFGAWLDRLLTDDLCAPADVEVRILEPVPA